MAADFAAPVSQQQGWRPARHSGREEVAGLCPFHPESPSLFLCQPAPQTFAFYEAQRPRFAEAQQYLASRGIHAPEIVARLRIGYAPGGCLRAHLEELGYARADMVHYGLIDGQGRDRFWRCMTFPLEAAGNLYGRAIDLDRPRHRFLPRPKGGLYGWSQAWTCSSLIVVEGLLDLAALWQPVLATP